MRRVIFRRSGPLELLGGATALLALSQVFVACQHAEAVQQLEEEAKKTSAASSAASSASSGSGGTSGGSNTTGGASDDGLTVTETDLGPDDFGGTPIVDEENRGTCTDAPTLDNYVPSEALRREAAGLVAQMTPDQKVIQLTGVAAPDYNDGNRWEDIQRSRDDEALNLRGYLWRDGPHGLNLESGRGRDPLENYATSFPTSVAQGAAFDIDLAYRVGEAMGDETLASGNNVLLGPCMNVLRHPFWGRAQETFGEDTFHLGRIATAVTRGIQQYVSGCAKHFLANNIENERFSISSNMDEQTLREVYGRHFEMVVRDGGVGCVMASYNAVNGTKSTQNKHTLTEMLRDDMGFQGFVLTDWWAMPGAGEGQGPVDPPADQQTAREALNAGLDVEVPWALNYDSIPTIVQEDPTLAPLVDAAVARVLEQKLRFDTAYLDGPLGPKTPTTTYDDSRGSVRNTEAHADLAQELAEKASVLLKNDALANGGPALPIPADVTKVAVIGAMVPYQVQSDNPADKVFDFARDAALGDRGSSRVRPDPALSVGPLAGITAAGQSAGVSVVGGNTAADAADADYVIAIVGLTAGDEGEEYTGASDRESLDLREEHLSLLNDVVALNKPTTVIIEAGAVVNTEPWRNEVDAVVMAWYPGMRAGAALGRLLFGQTNFAGRLPVTWPASEAQLPPFNQGDATVMDYYVGYKWFDRMEQDNPGQYQPLYAFGHGMSYSTFRYERLHIDCGNVTDDSIFNVEVDVRNSAGPAGDEVIFVFASYPNTQGRRPLKELKGFARTHLEPGQGKRVSIPVRVKDLKYWNDPSGWEVEQGSFLIQVGPSSDQLLLEQTATVN